MGLISCYTVPVSERNALNGAKRRTMEREAGIMFNPKGYYTNHGYTGFLPDGRRISFPTLDEYIDYVREIADDMR